MNQLVETATRLEASQDIAGLLELFQNPQINPNDLFDALYLLLPGNQITSAYIIAMLLANSGIKHPVVFFALIVGGTLHNNPIEENRGRTGMQEQMNSLPKEMRDYLDNHIILPVILNLMGPVLGQPDSTPQMLRLLEILKAAIPQFKQMFDWEVKAPEVTLEAIRQQGHQRSKLITYALPPALAPRPPRRAVVTTWGKAEGVAPMMAAAMNAYGWVAEGLHLPYTSVEELEAGCRSVIEICRQKDIEIIVLPFDQLVDTSGTAYRTMILELRRENPSIKIVAILYDGWGGRVNTIMDQAAPLLDVIWTADSPSLPIWNRPELANKVLQSMLPLFAMGPGSPDIPLIPELYFRGTLQGWNWPRAFWLTAIEHLNIPLKTRVARTLKVADDGLPHLESYALYMRELGAATCALNLTMRQNQERVVVGRGFEIPFSGSLLIQEATPDMDYFFVLGEHYLEFTSIAELSAIMRFITHKPQEAEEIRRRGNAFAIDRYSNEKLIGYLDKLLYWS